MGLQILPRPVLHAAIGVALHRVGAQQVHLGIGGRDAERLPGRDLGQQGQVLVKRRQAVAAADVEQQRRLVNAGLRALQRGAAKVVARRFGAGTGVQHRNVGIEHRHHPVLGLPVQQQQHAALGGGVDRAFAVLSRIHKIDRTAQLAVPRRQCTGGETAVVGRKVQRDGRAFALGQLPEVDLPERRVKDLQLGGIAPRLGDYGQRVVVGHGAQQDAFVERMGVEFPCAAGDLQFAAGPVVHHEPRAAHGQHRAGVAGLEAAHLAAVGRIDDYILGVQFHKTARQFLDLQRFADAGIHRPAAVAPAQIEREAVHPVGQQRDGGRHSPCKHGKHQRHSQYDDPHRDSTAALPLFEQRRDGAQVGSALRLPGGPVFLAADRLRGAQANVAAGAGDGLGGGMPLLPRQHPPAAFLAFLLGFVHRGFPPFLSFI